MKLAVTYENGQIFQHFGHTEQFKIYEVADGKIVSEEVVDTNGSGHGALAGLLARAVVVIDKAGKVVYTQLVPEITEEPDYDAAVEAVKAL